LWKTASDVCHVTILYHEVYILELDTDII